MSTLGVILAAGSGARFGADKALLPLRGKPVWKWSFDTFLGHSQVDAVGIVCSQSNIDQIRSQAAGAAFVIEGGTTRQESARAALAAAPDGTDVLLLQDAARPFTSGRLITDVVAATRRAGASAPAVALVDTIKSRTADGLVTLNRDKLVATQTPQGARVNLLSRAYEACADKLTDDLAVLEAAGTKPELVEGDPNNFKITTTEDYQRAQAYAGVGEVRTGIGYDVHPFTEDRVLYLGGVEFPDHRGLDGHSDADALLHAVVDALLGAAALGDIGEHFPPSDAQWKGRRSTEFLHYAGRLLNESGWRILNIDATVIAESPKIMSRAADIRRTIAEELRVTIDRVSIKATTNERMGFIGRGEGIAAFAVATIAGA